MIVGFLARAVDVAQVAFGLVVGPGLRAIDAVVPAWSEGTRHEGYGARGEAFVDRASTAAKAAFVAKLLGTTGARARPVRRRRDEGVARGPEIVIGGDVLQPEVLSAATFSPALRARLARADAVVLNLEGTLGAVPAELAPFQTWRGFRQLLAYATDAGSPGWVSRLGSRGVAELVRGLPNVVFTVANNHTVDEGEAGFAATVVEASVIGEVCGDARKGDGAVVVPVGEHRVGLFAIGYGHNRVGVRSSPHLGFSRVPYAIEPAAAARVVDALRARGATHVVAILHWGHEHEHEPTDAQRAVVETLFAVGVAAVVGHHPHLVQTCETSARGTAVYSLGDLVGGDRTVWSRLGALVSLVPESGGKMNAAIVPIAQSPYFRAQRTMLLDEAPWLERAMYALFFRWKAEVVVA